MANFLPDDTLKSNWLPGSSTRANAKDGRLNDGEVKQQGASKSRGGTGARQSDPDGTGFHGTYNRTRNEGIHDFARRMNLPYQDLCWEPMNVVTADIHVAD